MPASEVLDKPSWLKTSRSKNTVKAENVHPHGVGLKNFIPCATQNVHILKRIFGNLHGISWVCTQSVGSNKANDFPDRQHDWRQSRSENTVKAENVCPRGIWLKNFLPCTTKNVHVLKGIFRNLYGISWICTHFMGSNKAINRLDRQQVRHPLFPNKGNSASTLECVWLCAAI